MLNIVHLIHVTFKDFDAILSSCTWTLF